MSSSSPRVHFNSSFEEAPAQRQQIRSVLKEVSGPHPTPLGEPAWIVVRDVIGGTSTYIAHHTLSQFTTTAHSVSELCERVEAEMKEDTRYDDSSFRLDGRPNARSNHGPGRSELGSESQADN
jgi:hypothetical protein